MKVHVKDLIIVREIRQENGSMGTSEPESPRYYAMSSLQGLGKSCEQSEADASHILNVQ